MSSEVDFGSSAELGLTASASFNDFDEFDGDELLDDDAAFDEQFGAVALGDSAGGGLARAKSYENLDPSAIEAATKAQVAHVQEICGIESATVAAVLLRAHDWNEERLVERWMEDPERVLERAGVPHGKLVKKASSKKRFECPVCLDDVSSKASYALGCGHRYCNDCWKSYLETALEAAHTAAQTTCPHPKCHVLVHDEAFKVHLPPEQFARFERFVRRTFIDANPKAKWCPRAGCERAVKVDVGSRRDAVECSCGQRFCFACADAEIGDHSPASCADVEAWLRKASDESENLTWLAANTKKCPKCRSPIEKNGGCMHMTCATASCRHEFCWLCRGPWKEHGSSTGGYYKCNKYEKNKDAKAEEEAQRNAQNELEHYMFYYHRYESHRNARRVADEQRVQCAEKEAAVLAKFGVRSADTKFMGEATEQLLKCRRILEFSYVYGFYLSNRPGAERNLFEYLQEDVEKHTNDLSEQYERELSSMPDYAAFIAWKERVTNLTRVCGKFCDNFCEGVEKGLTSESK